MPHRPSPRSARAFALGIALILLVAASCRTKSSGGDAGSTAHATSTPISATQLALARQHIKHVVFVIKENRTFDNLFATFPGADTPPLDPTTHVPWGPACDGTMHYPRGDSKPNTIGLPHRTRRPNFGGISTRA